MHIRFIRGAVMAVALLGSAPAFAHISVKPAEVGVAAFQTFTTGVPNEKEGNPVVGVRLVLPEGLENTSPNVKPGWTIATKQEGSGETARVTEISWTGGSIPTGQRDEFSFSAKTPDKPTSLAWKAYETYADGMTVSWDQDPKVRSGEGSRPYSTTEVIDDLKASETNAAATGSESDGNTLPIILSVMALALAAASFLRKPTTK